MEAVIFLNVHPNTVFPFDCHRSGVRMEPWGCSSKQTCPKRACCNLCKPSEFVLTSHRSLLHRKDEGCKMVLSEFFSVHSMGHPRHKLDGDYGDRRSLALNIVDVNYGYKTTSPNNRKKDARLLYMIELASSRFAASWMPCNIFSGKRDNFFAVDVSCNCPLLLHERRT